MDRDRRDEWKGGPRYDSLEALGEELKWDKGTGKEHGEEPQDDPKDPHLLKPKSSQAHGELTNEPHHTDEKGETDAHEAHGKIEWRQQMAYAQKADREERRDELQNLERDKLSRVEFPGLERVE